MKKFIIAVLLVVLFTGIFLPLGGSEEGESASAEGLSPYEGKVYHIFFHSLILDPEAAFNGPRAEGYDNWMVTRNEFKKILTRLYENGFALVDVHYARSCGISSKPLMLPKGKKPLILSVDDVNYYEYMKNDGFAQRLTVDNNGKLAALVKNNKDKMYLDYEGDVMPIVDAFVEKHPDFSYNGAKGIVAVTGYEGVFGYRIQALKGVQKGEAVREAKKVADALKKNGWRIACHSYSHRSEFKDGSISYDMLVTDTKKWKELIEPVAGKSDIYISPFGMHLSAKDERLKFLREAGFTVYCPVYKKMDVYYNGDVMVSNRLNIDGFTLRHPERLKELFSVDNLTDNVRPKRK